MSKKNTYKNISGMPQDLIGYGHVEAGATIETSDIINNGNFELQSSAAVEKPSEPKKAAKEDKY